MGEVAKLCAVCVMLMIPSGCAIFPKSLVEQNIVRVEIEQSEFVRIQNVTVFREGNMTVVYGETVLPFWKRYDTFTGHIDININMPNGKSIGSQNISLARRPAKRGSIRKATFVSQYSAYLPEGSVVHLTYHIGGHMDAG